MTTFTAHDKDIPNIPRVTPEQADLLSPNAYMDLLLERQREYEQEHPPAGWVRTLPTWFIRDGDEHLVDMAAIEAANTAGERVEKRPTKPRRYKPASHWRDVVDRTQKRMDVINGYQRHDTTDPAAYGGVGVRQTARAGRKHWQRIDSLAAEYARLEKRLAHATSMLRKAERREA